MRYFRYFRLLIGGFALLGAQLSFSDTPMGVYYQMQVSDPSAVVAAMSEFQNSETAKDRKVTVTLKQIISNGTNPATHAVSVLYQSAAHMDSSRAALAQSKDWAKMQRAMSSVTTAVSESVFRTTGITGGSADNITSKNPVHRYISMNVRDPAKYVEAWQKLQSSRSGDNGASTIIQVMAAGDMGITHVVSLSANSMADLMSGNQNDAAWREFLASVRDIRDVVDDAIVVDLMAWGA